jgi:hypothetical protein
MGADLYIESIYDEHKAKHQPAFDKAVNARDAHSTEHGCHLSWTGTGDETSECPQLVKLQAKVRKTYEVLFSDNPGYYRDSYNNSNLPWRLEYKDDRGPNSYWTDTKTDRNGNMSVRRAKAWLKAVKGAKIRPLTTSDGRSTSSDGWSSKLTPEQVKEWNDYFVQKKAKLEAFLQRAIDLNQPIHCSC